MRVGRRWPGRALAQTPVLLATYFAWSNFPRRDGPGHRRWLRGASGVVLGYFAAFAWGAYDLRSTSAAAPASFAWIEAHVLFCGALAALVAAMLVARRRALNRLVAGRAWTAALPVGRSTAQWQAVAVETAPALGLVAVLAVLFGSASLLAWIVPGISAPLGAWGATTAGVLLGACVAYGLPAARPEELYEGSRYVPHRTRTRTPIPSGSLRALGLWPVRHAVASARPRTIARAIVPLLLAVPLNSTAADAMLALGLLTAIGAQLLLAVATLSVTAKAGRWLLPLPLAPRPLARWTMTRALAAMACSAAVESWLLWVAGQSVVRSLAVGCATLLVAMSVTCVGCGLKIHAAHPHRA